MFKDLTLFLRGEKLDLYEKMMKPELHLLNYLKDHRNYIYTQDNLNEATRYINRLDNLSFKLSILNLQLKI
jgi:hypothetical protein